MKYETIEDIELLIDAFESGAIAREDWRHHEHLTVALWYLSREPATALNRVRDGIHNLLKSFGLDPLAADTPYHETLTVFWVETVRKFLSSNDNLSLPECDAELAATFDKDYPLEFYSREVLFGEEARRTYVAPDLTATVTFVE